MAQVYYSVLIERTIPDHAFSAFMDMAMRAGHLGYARINIGYSRVDVARNTVAKAFILQTKSDDDTLVMLDCDHTHPDDVVERLARHDEDVVVALAFRRCPPYDPQIYRHGQAGNLVQPTEWGQGLLKIDAFGMAAIAIKRRVFRKLDESGMSYPYFRFWYPKGMGLREQVPLRGHLLWPGLRSGRHRVLLRHDGGVPAPDGRHRAGRHLGGVPGRSSRVPARYERGQLAPTGPSGRSWGARNEPLTPCRSPATPGRRQPYSVANTVLRRAGDSLARSRLQRRAHASGLRPLEDHGRRDVRPESVEKLRR